MDAVNILLMALNATVGGFCVVLWTILNNIRTKSDKTADELAMYKLLVAEKFITKAELKDYADSIKHSFESYATRMDVRMDRLESRIMEMKDKS